MTDTFDRDAFLAERRQMLLALDPATMRAFLIKYGEDVPDSDDVCLIAMHKARCEALDLADTERTKSRFWLKQRGFQPGVIPPKGRRSR